MAEAFRNFPRLEPQQLHVLKQLYKVPTTHAMGSEGKHWNRAAQELVELSLATFEDGYYHLTKMGRELALAAILKDEGKKQ